MNIILYSGKIDKYCLNLLNLVFPNNLNRSDKSSIVLGLFNILITFSFTKKLCIIFPILLAIDVFLSTPWMNPYSFNIVCSVWSISFLLFKQPGVADNIVVYLDLSDNLL